MLNMNFVRGLIKNGIPQSKIMAGDMMLSQKLDGDLLFVLNMKIFFDLLHRDIDTDNMIFLESQFMR